MVTKPLLILLPIFLSYVCVLGVFPKKVPIVGLFNEAIIQDEEIQRLFESSVTAVNKDRHNNISELSNVFLVPQMEEIETDPFEVSSKVCELLQLGIVGVFGPQEKVAAEHVQSLCDAIEVPHISVRQDFDQLSRPRGLGLNLYPHVNSLARVYNQLVTEFKWKSFAILYENADSLIRMRLLLKRWDSHGNSAFVYHLGYGPSYRNRLETRKMEKKRFKRTQVRHSVSRYAQKRALRIERAFISLENESTS